MRYHESWPVAPIVLALLLAACTGPQGGRPAHTIAKARTAPPCRTAALTLGNGPTLVPMTSEHGDFYTLTNHGHRTCTLTGYPKVVLYDARAKPMPFHYAHQLRPYLTAITPAETTIAPSASADVLVVKYTCVLGALRTAATIRLTLPGYDQAVLTTPVTRNGLGCLRCPTAKAARIIPGRLSPYRRSNQQMQEAYGTGSGGWRRRRPETAACPLRAR